MKYAGEYYSKLSKFNKTYSNMNRLCYSLEKWDKKFVKFKNTEKDFNYKIMMSNDNIPEDETYLSIEKIFIEFCDEMNDLSKLSYKCKNFDKFKNYFKENYPETSLETFKNFEVNWKYYYNIYFNKCKEVCPDKQKLANICVDLCYRKYPNKNKKFIWKVASEGILLNIKQCQISLPELDDNGEFEYLGKKYSYKNVLEDSND